MEHAAGEQGTNGGWVLAALEHAGHLLPAQGPMSVFVHHNTLHAFQHLPFHEAVVRAQETLGGEPYLTLPDYRDAYARGRVTAQDVTAVLGRHGGEDGPLAGGVVTRRKLQWLAMVHGLEAETPGGLSWLMAEAGMLQRLPADVPQEAAAALLARGDVEKQLRGLWDRALAITPQALSTPPTSFVLGRDGLHHHGLVRLGKDVNLLGQVHALAIKLAEGFLDLGMAAWPLPRRDAGLWPAFLALFAHSRQVAPERAALGPLLDALVREDVDAPEAVERALDALAVPAAHREDYLRGVMMALPGWCGMFQRLQAQPQEGPAGVPVRLVDFVAVLLWLEVAALRAVVDRLGEKDAAALVDRYARAQAAQDTPGPESTAYRVWRLWVYAGVTAEQAAGLDASHGAELLHALRAFDALTQRRLWHEAYEKNHRELHLDALAARRQSGPVTAAAPAPAGPPPFQVVCCIDEREESFRRHLEEVQPQSVTFGTAGFFGLAITYADADERHAVPLCPVDQKPTHAVVEIPLDPDQHQRRQRQRRAVAFVWHVVRGASKGAVRGLLVSVVLGLLGGVVTAARVGSPRATGRARSAVGGLLARSPTRLGALQEDGVDGGYTPQEAAAKVSSLLQNVGLTSGFAPLVTFLGHGSTSLNNPHESAHDCGACGGRRGAPNARLVASLANAPAVRAALAHKGITIPDTTWFVGGYHDTSSDEVTLFDTHLVPAAFDAQLKNMVAALDEARARNAHERSRRFAWAPKPATPRSALAHVEGRADALGEPRPEYGHCTNAMAVVGRRALTRGLYLDRRAFLVSYDPEQDQSGAVLERILSAVGPVGAGISLEYYFSFVDNRRWGCGTKLPHNVTGLLGVMDGHQSDLRTGLPLQMVELHEPVRLLMVVEATPERLLEIAGRQPVVKELVVNAWVQLVSVDPNTGAMQVFQDGAFEPYTPRPVRLPVVGRSDAWYAGHAEHLGPALVGTGVAS